MTDGSRRSLFDGETLHGWHSTPRLFSEFWPGGPTARTDSPEYRRRAVELPARWTVEGDAIVGQQWPPGSGYGGFLLTDASFADFELTLEAKPDWPADTGIYLRKTEDDWAGIQILLDHREGGGIGGFFGNGIGAFHAAPFTVHPVERDGAVIGITATDSSDQLSTSEHGPALGNDADLLSYSASGDEFLKAWRWGDWNEFRIRCEGIYPTISVWINGVPVSEIDLSRIRHPHYDKETMLETLGRSGPIGLEVHENDVGMGERRWGNGAKCRWRNISVLEL